MYTYPLSVTTVSSSETPRASVAPSMPIDDLVPLPDPGFRLKSTATGLEELVALKSYTYATPASLPAVSSAGDHTTKLDPEMATRSPNRSSVAGVGSLTVVTGTAGDSPVTSKT